ncbi:MAG: hypothetical protein LBM66_00535 [Bifidobacteriaceae bacterium]|nr:hypothetical protein [Bifidobacteriaceae bacterium]
MNPQAQRGPASGSDPTVGIGTVPSSTPILGATLVPEEAARLVADQRAATRRAIYPSSAYLWLVWGAAWLIGYGLLGATAGPRRDAAPWSWICYVTCLVAATAATLAHTSRRASGQRGRNRRGYVLSGLTWFVAVAGTGLALSAIAASFGTGVPGYQITQLFYVVYGLVIGTLFMAGGAMLGVGSLFGVGAWIALTAAAAALTDFHAGRWVTAIAGGGGMVAAGLVTAVLSRRAARPAAGLAGTVAA